jgi:hypothetical protein
MNTVFFPRNIVTSKRSNAFDTGETQCNQIFLGDFNHYNPFLTEMEYETDFVGLDQEAPSSRHPDDHSTEAHIEFSNTFPFFVVPPNKEAEIQLEGNSNHLIDQANYFLLQNHYNLEPIPGYSVEPLYVPYKSSCEYRHNPFEFEDGYNCAHNPRNKIGEVYNNMFMPELSDFQSQNQEDTVFLESMNPPKQVYIEKVEFNRASGWYQTDFSSFQKKSPAAMLKIEQSFGIGSIEIGMEEDNSSFLSSKNDKEEVNNTDTIPVDSGSSVLRLDSDQYFCSDARTGFRALTEIMKKEEKVKMVINSVKAKSQLASNVLKIEPPRIYLDFLKFIAPKPTIDNKKNSEPLCKKKIRHNCGSKTPSSNENKPDDNSRIPTRIVRKLNSNWEGASILDRGMFKRHYNRRSIIRGRKFYIDFIEFSNKSIV